MPAAPFMDSRVRVTWLIHVTPWRVDAVIIHADDVWVETSMNLADGKDPLQAPAALHRPKDTALLLATLTSLGVYGDTRSAQNSTSSPTPRPVAFARVAAVIPGTALGPTPGALPWSATTAAPGGFSTDTTPPHGIRNGPRGPSPSPRG